jgi:3-phenylpropionate/trans-cinnamate dioxygenase ferredoxin subunit
LKYVVASADEIPPGERKIVDVAGRSIGVFNVDGEYFALRNRCPHQGGALCEGRLWGILKADVPGGFDYSPSKEILTCPWHGWEFHVRTGQSWCDPWRLRVRRYDVSVEAYPVSVEGTCLVVDVATRAPSQPTSTST